MEDRINELSEKVKIYESLQPHEKLTSLNQGLYEEIEKLEGEINQLNKNINKPIKKRVKKGNDSETFANFFNKANEIKEVYSQGDLSLDDKIQLYRELAFMLNWSQQYLDKEEMIVIDDA